MADVRTIINETAARYGVDPTPWLRKAQIESSMNPAARNPSGATGLFQFMPKTWAQYGQGKDPLDPYANTDAAMRLGADNARHFKAQFGRDPSPSESYLMHQQGAGGATKLLQNPDQPATAVLGRQPVLQNGGNEAMTAREFAGLWQNKFDGTAAPQNSPQPAIAPAETAPSLDEAALSPGPSLDIGALLTQMAPKAIQPAARQPQRAQPRRQPPKKPDAGYILDTGL